MSKLVFILGKNWLLSIAELIVYLEDRGYYFEIVNHSRNAAVVNIEEGLTDETIVDIQSALGGCYKIARVVEIIPKEKVEKAFPSRGSIDKQAREEIANCRWVKRVFPKIGARNIKFGVSTYPLFKQRDKIDLKRFTRALDEYVKKKLLNEGARRAKYFAYDEPDRRNPSRTNTALWPQTIARHKLLVPPNAEIITAIMETEVYLAKTIVVYDSILQQYRDEARSYVSAEISTSPKICRTLLTLAGAKDGDTILDPSCGTGTLLMEAALLDMKAIGIDIDGNAVEGTKANMLWLAKDLGMQLEFEVIRGDAREAARLVRQVVDAVVFEPHLGPVFKEKPSRDDAERIAEELADLYKEVLLGITGILRQDGRVAMTIPVFLTKNGEVTIDTTRMLQDTGFTEYFLLPQDVVSKSKATDRRLTINGDRKGLPERKHGQYVQRTVLMLGRI